MRERPQHSLRTAAQARSGCALKRISGRSGATGTSGARLREAFGHPSPMPPLPRVTRATFPLRSNGLNDMWFVLTRVRALALLGRKDEALKWLQQLPSAGMQVHWRELEIDHAVAN